MKAIVCDPVCAQPFGHNAPALRLFGQAMQEFFDEVVMVCCKYLPERLVTANNFVPLYDFYYHDYISLPNTPEPSAAPDLVKMRGQFADPLEASATADAEYLLSNNNLTHEDAIIFPSVDFYGAIGLFNALANVPADKQPRIFLRFIGVMEGSTKFYRDPLNELALRLKDAQSAGLKLSLTAETPLLSDSLAERFSMDVGVTPYPDIHAPLPYPMVGNFNVFVPGSGREDKGFFQLHEIFTQVRQNDPHLSIRFTAQSIGQRVAENHQTYISRLYAIPGVRLLPSIISDEEMLLEYKRCALVLLPYDRHIYALRGSAGMMEAASFARPILTYSGSAFAEQIAWYRLGLVLDTQSALVDMILSCARQPRSDLERRALRGRRRFLSDVEQAYRSWLVDNT